MKKVVVVIEDSLFSLDDVFLNIQSVLVVASKRNLTNAPTREDTEICVLFVDRKNEKDNEERFNRVKLKLENRQQLLSEKTMVPEIKCTYHPIKIDVDNYPNNCTECKEKISNELNEIIDGKEYAIMLDLFLFDQTDESILKKDKKNKVLSQLLYEKYKDKVIPYTKFTQEPEAIKLWMDGVKRIDEPLNRKHISGNQISKKFKELLYGKLNIGGTQDD